MSRGDGTGKCFGTPCANRTAAAPPVTQTNNPHADWNIALGRKPRLRVDWTWTSTDRRGSITRSLTSLAMKSLGMSEWEQLRCSVFAHCRPCLYAANAFPGRPAASIRWPNTCLNFVNLCKNSQYLAYNDEKHIARGVGRKQQQSHRVRSGHASTPHARASTKEKASRRGVRSTGAPPTITCVHTYLPMQQLFNNARCVVCLHGTFDRPLKLLDGRLNVAVDGCEKLLAGRLRDGVAGQKVTATAAACSSCCARAVRQSIVGRPTERCVANVARSFLCVHRLLADSARPRPRRCCRGRWGCTGAHTHFMLDALKLCGEKTNLKQ